jgi:hypothetical protein
VSPPTLRARGHLVFLGFALTLVTLWNLGPVGAGDIWWHLRSGDLILDQGVPATDPFSWTAHGVPWQLNAWFGDVAMAVGRRAGGLGLLAGFTIVTVAAAGAGTYLLARRWGALPWPAATVTAIATALMSPFILVRPLLAGLALFPFVVLLADAALTGSRRGLVGMAALLVLWANLHASFSVGVAVVGLLALGTGVARRAVLLPGVVAVTAAVAGLVTPYGLDGYLHAFTVQSASSTIEEWQPLDLADPRGLLVACFALVMAVAVAAFPPRNVDDTDDGAGWRRPFWAVIPVLAALAVLSFGTIRSAAFLLMAGTPAIAIAAGRLHLPRLRSWFRPRRGAVLLGLLVAWLVAVVPLLPQLTRLGDIGDDVPVAATDAIPAGCHLLNEYEYGGFVIDRRWPEVLVSQDGRNDLYGPERLEVQESLLAGRSVQAVEDFGAGCVLLHADRPLAAALEDGGTWERAGGGGGAVLYVRSG